MSVEEFNKKLKEKLEDKFGKEYVDNKIVIIFSFIYLALYIF